MTPAILSYLFLLRNQTNYPFAGVQARILLIRKFNKEELRYIFENAFVGILP